MNRSFAITAKQLKTFNEKAHQEKQNRILDIKDKNSTPESNAVELDMSKKAVVTPLMLHTNYRGVRSWRCHITFGIKGQDEPVSALLDVPLKYRRTLLNSPINPDGTIAEPDRSAPLSMIGGYADDFQNPDASSDDSSSE